MRILIIILLALSSAVPGAAQNAKPKAADPLASVRAHLKAVPPSAGHHVARLPGKPGAPPFVQAPVAYTPPFVPQSPGKTR